MNVFQYKSNKLFVVDTPTTVSFQGLQEKLSDIGVSPETLTQHQTERIYMKWPIGDEIGSHPESYSWAEKKRIAMTLEIQPDPELLEEYKRVHRPENIWQQINDNMDTMGVVDMELYLIGYRVFLIMDVPQDFDLDKEGERWGKLPREQEWQNYVSRFQKTDPESKIEEKWEMMNPI